MKKLLHTLFIILATAAFLTSCRSSYDVPIQPELEELFKGKTYAEIVDALGAPERTTPDGRGGQILVFEEMTFRTEGSMNMWTRNYESITESSKGYVQLYMNADDICYAVKSNKTREESEFSKGKTIGLVAGIGGGLAMLAAIIFGSR